MRAGLQELDPLTLPLPVPTGDGSSVAWIPAYLRDEILTPVIGFWTGPVVAIVVFAYVAKRVFRP